MPQSWIFAGFCRPAGSATLNRGPPKIRKIGSRRSGLQSRPSFMLSRALSFLTTFFEAVPIG